MKPYILALAMLFFFTGFAQQKRHVTDKDYATATVAGVIKPGTGMTVDANGFANVTASGGGGTIGSLQQVSDVGNITNKHLQATGFYIGINNNNDYLTSINSTGLVTSYGGLNIYPAVVGSKLTLTANPTTNITATFQNRSGTVAYLDDITSGGGTAQNFFNANLTLTGDRTHIGNDNGFQFLDIGYFIFETSKNAAVTNDYSSIDAANNVITIGNYGVSGGINSKLDVTKYGMYLTGPVQVNSIKSAANPIDRMVVVDAQGVLKSKSLTRLSTQVTTSTYSVPEGIDVILVNYSTGTATVTLPAVASHTGREITVKNLTSNNVTISGVWSQDVNTLTSFGAITYYSNGSNWYAINNY